MKTKLKVVQENGMYVGYCLQNDEIVVKTPPCKDSTSASRNLSILVGKLQSPTHPRLAIQKPSGPSANKFTPPSTVPMSHIPSKTPKPSSPRKCCGRG